MHISNILKMLKSRPKRKFIFHYFSLYYSIYKLIINVIRG